MSETKAKPAATHATPMIAPNMYSLSGDGLYVSYSTTSINGQPRFSYQDTMRSLSFTGDEIRVVTVPDLGTVVSVTIMMTVDSGSTTFSLLLPHVTLSGVVGSAPIRTDGITTHHAFSIVPAFNHGQRDFYLVTALSGTASHFIF